MPDNPIFDIPSGETAMQNCEENKEGVVDQDKGLDDEDEDLLDDDVSFTEIQINKEF